MLAASTLTAAQKERQRQLEEYKRKKELEKKVVSQKTSRSFVVPVPKRDPTSTFVPSIIRTASPTKTDTKKSTLNESYKRSQKDSLDANQKHAQFVALLRQSLDTALNSASELAVSAQERACVSKCRDAVDKALSNSDAFVRSSPSHRKTSIVEKTTPIHDAVSSMTPLTTRPPTPAFLEYRETKRDDEDVGDEAPTEAEDQLLSSSEMPTYNDEDDEVIMNGIDDDDEFAFDATPPKSKYLDLLLANDEMDEFDPAMIPQDRPDLDDSNVKEISDAWPRSPSKELLEKYKALAANSPDSLINRKSLPVQPTNGTPHPKKSGLRSRNSTPTMNSITSLLSSVKISANEPMSPSAKTKTPTNAHSVRKMRSGKEMRVGFKDSPTISKVKQEDQDEVVIGDPTADGSVIVLTPRKANRKEKEELGVDSVVTNARRSMRFLPTAVDLTQSPTATSHSASDSTHIKSENSPFTAYSFKTAFGVTNGPLSAFGPDARERVQKLLEEHGNAFVPNKRLAMPAHGMVQPQTTPKSASKIRTPLAGLFTSSAGNTTPVSPFTAHSIGKAGGSQETQEEGELTPRARKY
ncbi:hypothetical protein HDU77_003957 [Chytriomyces hyalinus]|nr:hypothetical protein HDU77_003957 [Chytriomyces hyalinus]